MNPVSDKDQASIHKSLWLHETGSPESFQVCLIRHSDLDIEMTDVPVEVIALVFQISDHHRCVTVSEIRERAESDAILKNWLPELTAYLLFPSFRRD